MKNGQEDIKNEIIAAIHEPLKTEIEEIKSSKVKLKQQSTKWQHNLK